MAAQGKTLRIQFRGSPADLRRLEVLARRWECGHADALRRLLRESTLEQGENSDGKSKRIRGPQERAKS
jgi:hypothetical protein